MKPQRLFLSLVLGVAGILLAGCAAGHPKPQAAATLDPAALESAVARGIDFLLKDQNPDGSWGSATRTKGLNIYAPIPGAHHAFRTAVTSMCIMAILECCPDEPRVAQSLAKAEKWLLENVSRVRRAEMEAIYNVWSHAYSIQALVRMLRRQTDESMRKTILDLIAGQVESLRRYEFVGGGWGYYDFSEHMQRPGGEPNSFTTATVLMALAEAEAEGVKVLPALIQRGLTEINRQRKPDMTYVYSRSWTMRPMGPINRPGGSLGRSQACNAALRTWGDPRITDEVLTQWLDRLFARNGWLSIGRKRPVPHESWFQVAGYFYYYGHYYAALCIEFLGPEAKPFYQDHMAQTLMALQEKDGSWWDFPFYDYHQPYGTAFALMALKRCRS